MRSSSTTVRITLVASATILCSALSWPVVAAPNAPGASAAAPADSGDASPAAMPAMGTELIQSEAKFRAEMALKMHDLERAQVDARIAEERSKQRQSDSRSSDGGVAFPPVAAVTPAQGSNYSFPNVSPPPGGAAAFNAPSMPSSSGLPSLKAIVGDTAVFNIGGEQKTVRAGQVVAGYNVVDVAANKVHLERDNKSYSVQMELP